MEAVSEEELVVIPPNGGALALTVPQERALTFFTRPGAIDPVLEAIRKELDAFTPDVTTAKGRKEIASMAFKVAQSKAHLESVGKRLADEQKEIPKKIDASRKRIRDTLDKWRDEVRAPLTEWEEAEERRVAAHHAAMDGLAHAGREPGDCSAALLREALAGVEAVQISKEACEEFVAEYATLKEEARIRLTDAIAKAEKREAEAAELERLRAEEAARKAKEAEEQAAREREAREAQIAEEARLKAEADAKRREDALLAEKEAAERRAKEAEEKAERERQDAARREQEAADRVKREAEAAKAREEEEARQREANKAHRAKINNAAVAAFVAGGLSEGAAKAAVTLIAQQKIPAIAISY